MEQLPTCSAINTTENDEDDTGRERVYRSPKVEWNRTVDKVKRHKSRIRKSGGRMDETREQEVERDNRHKMNILAGGSGPVAGKFGFDLDTRFISWDRCACNLRRAWRHVDMRPSSAGERKSGLGHPWIMAAGDEGNSPTTHRNTKRRRPKSRSTECVSTPRSEGASEQRGRHRSAGGTGHISGKWFDKVGHQASIPFDRDCRYRTSR